MSTFTRDDVQRLAALARLELSAEETGTFTRQLGDVLEFVRQIQLADTSSLTLTPLPEGGVSMLREDVVRPSLDRTDVLAAAPDADTITGLFKVPRVLNG
jgi:aspartyl-tRNA(Asn)/glutamyl-tRNA(Gln) amidotransferase subunit C